MSHVCISVVEFLDGGSPSAMVLHRGTEADCNRIAPLLSAVSYSGPSGRVPVCGYICVITEQQWNESTGDV